MTTPATRTNVSAIKNRWWQAAVTAAIALALILVALAAVRPASAHTQLAAIVNNDEPVTIDGQMAPLGRQLAAELVAQEGPFKWEITTETIAREGLDSGHYAGAVIIPPEFSAATTSLASLDAAVQANVSLLSPPGASSAQRVALQDDVWRATASLGSQLTEAFVSGIFGGLGEMRDGLGEAADGAGQLADGTRQLDEGVTELSAGTSLLATGANEAGAGMWQLASGTAEFAGGTHAAAQGATELANGMWQLSAGGKELSAGMSQMAAGTAQMDAEVSAGMAQFDEMLDQTIYILQQVEALTQGIDPAQVAEAITVIQQGVEEFLRICAEEPGSPLVPVCEYLENQGILEKLENIDELLGMLENVPPLEEVEAQIREAQAGLNELTGGVTELNSGMQQLAAGMEEYSGGVTAAASGTSELAAGLYELAAGADQLADGTGQAANGIGQLAGGVGELAAGTKELNSGTGQLADGAADLAAGLGTASDEIPSLDARQAANLGEVLASPVAAPDYPVEPSSTPAVVTVLLLWLASLFLFLIYPRAVPELVSSTRSAFFLTLKALLLPAGWMAGISAVAGGSLAWFTGAGPGAWAGLIAVALLAGAVFVAIQQALMLAGGTGGAVLSLSALVVAVSAALAPPGPSPLASIAAVLPTGPATRLTEFLVIPGFPPVGWSLVALVLWGLFALLISAAASSTIRKNPLGALA